MLENRLRELRLKAGLKQEDLIKRFNLSSGRYSQYETGKRKPDYDLLIELADFYNVSLDYLLGRTSDPSPLVKEKTPSYQKEVMQDIEDITPEMATEVRQFISYLKHKKESAAETVAKKIVPFCLVLSGFT